MIELCNTLVYGYFIPSIHADIEKIDELCHLHHIEVIRGGIEEQSYYVIGRPIVSNGLGDEYMPTELSRLNDMTDSEKERIFLLRKDIQKFLKIPSLPNSQLLIVHTVD